MAQALTGHLAASRTVQNRCSFPGGLQRGLQRTPFVPPQSRSRHRLKGAEKYAGSGYACIERSWSNDVQLGTRRLSISASGGAFLGGKRGEPRFSKRLAERSKWRRNKILTQAGDDNGMLHMQQNSAFEEDESTNRSLEEERAQSGRAASTSENDISADRSEASADSQTGTARRGRAPRKPSKAATLGKQGSKKGRDLMSQLLGNQSAWLSAPLLALAKKKTKSRRRSVKTENRSEVEDSGTGQEKFSQSTESVRAVGRKRGPKKDESVERSSLLQGEARESLDGGAEVESAEVSGRTPSDENEQTSNKRHERASPDVVLEPTGYSARQRLRDRTASKAETGVAEQTGLSREEFIRRLEELQEGLGVAAESLVREGKAVKLQEESGLLLSAEELGIDAELLGSEKRQLSAVAGGVTRPSKRPPQNRSRLRALSPVKRDANAAVARIMASRVRQNRRRMDAPFKAEGDSDSEAEEEDEEAALYEALNMDGAGLAGELEAGVQNGALRPIRSGVQAPKQEIDGAASELESRRNGAENGALRSFQNAVRAPKQEVDEAASEVEARQNGAETGALRFTRSLLQELKQEMEGAASELGLRRHGAENGALRSTRTSVQTIRQEMEKAGDLEVRQKGTENGVLSSTRTAMQALKQEMEGAGESEMAQNGAQNGTPRSHQKMVQGRESSEDTQRSERKDVILPSTEAVESNGWYSESAGIARREANVAEGKDVQPQEHLAQSRNGVLQRPEADRLRGRFSSTSSERGQEQEKVEGLLASVLEENRAVPQEAQKESRKGAHEVLESLAKQEEDSNLTMSTASKSGAASRSETETHLEEATKSGLHELVESRLVAGREGADIERVDEETPTEQSSNGGTSFFSGDKKQQDLVKRVAQSRPPEELRTLEELGRKNQESEGFTEPQTLVSASRRIGEDPQTIPATGRVVESSKPAYVGRRPAKNYTSEEDEQLFEKLGFRLTGSELGRIEEWLSSREVPELKLPRPRDRTGRYFIMPIIKAVEEHLRALGRLDSQQEESQLTPPGVPQAVSGETADQFFQEMREELSADVVLQTKELLASQVSENEEAKRRSASDVLDCFSDDSDSEHDVESLFQKVGLSANAKKRELGNFERSEIARFLMGLNRQGIDPPSKEDWPRSLSGERYGKDTLREVWRRADEMGGLQTYLRWCQEEEDIERLLVDTLCKNRLLKGEDWRKLHAEESAEVEAMDPSEKLKAVEFLVRILEVGERLDWKKHRDIWPRSKRSAHLVKSTSLLAVVKVARKHGGLQAYLEMCRKDLNKPLSIGPYITPSEDWPKIGRSPNHPEILQQKQPNGFSLSDRESTLNAAPSRVVNGKGGTESASQLKGVAVESKGWRGRSFSRGGVAQINAQSNSQGAVGTRLPDGAGLSSDVLSSRSGHFSGDPSPGSDLPSDRRLIPRGFSIPQPKETRDTGFAFWRVNNNDARPSSPQLPTRSNLTPPQSESKGMIRSSSKAEVPTLEGGSFQQQKEPPAESRWPTESVLKPQPIVRGPVVDTFPSKQEEPKRPQAEKRASVREVSPIERRRRRRLLGIKVQKHEDGEFLGENEVFEVTVGRPRRTMREILSGYAQEKVLVRAEELAQPLLVEDTPRSIEDGLLETLVSGHKSEMEEFKDTSRQYMRAWQDFQTWSDFFQYKNKKRPTITDVEATGIPWLIEKAKAYVLLRKHMIQLAEGNEKLLSAMATIQAELNRRTTASVATDKGSTIVRYQLQSTPAPKRARKGRPRTKKQLGDPVGVSIIEELGLGKDYLE